MSQYLREQFNKKLINIERAKTENGDISNFGKILPRINSTLHINLRASITIM